MPRAELIALCAVEENAFLSFSFRGVPGLGRTVFVFALEIPRLDADAVPRLLRAVGAHRYVKSRALEVHAMAVLAAGPEDETLAPLVAWARTLKTDPTVDMASRDPRLMRRCTEAELGLVLRPFWRQDTQGERVRQRLRDELLEADLPVSDQTPFDEAAEEDMHPVLVDAGWELLLLQELDPERHRGVLAAFDALDEDEEGETLAVARFEEESFVESPTYLHELPALGSAELLRGTDGNGLLLEEFALWADGPEPYHDYLLRGILKMAKLEGDGAQGV